jgi:hypothetical protein
MIKISCVMCAALLVQDTSGFEKGMVEMAGVFVYRWIEYMFNQLVSGIVLDKLKELEGWLVKPMESQLDVIGERNASLVASTLTSASGAPGNFNMYSAVVSRLHAPCFPCHMGTDVTRLRYSRGSMPLVSAFQSSRDSHVPAMCFGI